MSHQTPLRIVVTGYAASYPFGGVFWDYLQYVLGFQQLGHDVLYLEDTGRWCYDPVKQDFVEDGSHNARHLERQLKQLNRGLEDKWFYRDASGATYGRAAQDVTDFCRSADLFLNISASCWMRDEYFEADCTAFIDSDPMYTQSSVPGYLDGELDADAVRRVDMLREHDVHFTFGENIAHDDCLVPDELFTWIPTRQPIVLECFKPHQVPICERRRFLTTVASWEPAEDGPVVKGVKYTGKSTEFEKFIDLPKLSNIPLELAMSGRAPSERLTRHGWWMRDAFEVSQDPWVYRDYLAGSCGEWSVAKNAYVQSRSGWFSCRTACYLALGVPAVVQQTGFADEIPTDEGVLAFETVKQAADCIESLASNPEKHSHRAIEIAESCFDSNKVLSSLLDHAGSTVSRSAVREVSS